MLEQKYLEQVGCNITHPLDIRVITATNKDLATEVASGRFRADLFYRLNTVTLTLPPLRERREDIPALAGHFIQRFNQRFSKKINGITSDAMEELTGRPWSGNVRELKNAIEHALVYCPGDVIDIKDMGQCEDSLFQPLCEEKRKGERRLPTPLSPRARAKPYPDANLDTDTLRNALEQHHWHLGRTAAALGMHRTTLWRHMQRFGLASRN